MCKKILLIFSIAILFVSCIDGGYDKENLEQAYFEGQKNAIEGEIRDNYEVDRWLKLTFNKGNGCYSIESVKNAYVEGRNDVANDDIRIKITETGYIWTTSCWDRDGDKGAGSTPRYTPPIEKNTEIILIN